MISKKQIYEKKRYKMSNLNNNSTVLRLAAFHYYGPSFGIVNLAAIGDQTKYFPDELLRDLRISHMNAKEILSFFMSIGIDGDGDIIRDWYINLRFNIFIKKILTRV